MSFAGLISARTTSCPILRAGCRPGTWWEASIPLTQGRSLTGQEPKDDCPVLLSDWIKTDGLTCLKVKLRGTDAAWDYERLVRVGKIGVAQDVEWLSADFNCTVNEPIYVDTILDRLRDEHPRCSA